MLEAMEVSRLDGPPSAAFDCGRPVQNAFFHERAWADQGERLSTTYTFGIHGIVAGFATVCMDSLPLKRRERPSIPYSYVGALKLAQLGIDRRFQGEGLGRWAVGYVVDFATELGMRVGCRYVTLDAQPELEAWYAGQGFVRNLLRQEQRVIDALAHHRDLTSVAVSMRFDLREAA